MDDNTVHIVLGPVTLKGRMYYDHLNDVRVALLDRFLLFEGGKFTPFLVEFAVKWASSGPSNRDTRGFKDLFGYQLMNHEKIRQEVIKLKPKNPETKVNDPKEIDVLFIECDGLHVHSLAPK